MHPYTNYAAAVNGTGTIVEHNTFSGTRVGLISPYVGECLHRANDVTVKDIGQVPDYWPPYVSNPCGLDLTTSSDNPILAGNTYSSSDSYVDYYKTVACPFAQKPVSLYRMAKMTGFVGGQVADVTVPVANAGIEPWTWSASTNDTWITPSITGNDTIDAEGDTGELAISVDTAGLSLGRHWGYVTLTGSGGQATVGVCLDLVQQLAQVETPSFSPAAGTYGSEQSVTITTATSGASIRYTTDGMTPSDTVGTLYASPVQINQNTTLKAIAYKTRMRWRYPSRK